ncbi:hypothetical protein [Comamonas serinivorans]|uniref:hypothetical protein n=1 Tax=Comamonas serinivorans TaxID=1082851 RepID=UPI00146BD6E7|nr:hypothetical protein [Comamonas serinivorans]
MSGASLHFVIDQARGFVGSFNFDPRSALKPGAACMPHPQAVRTGLAQGAWACHAGLRPVGAFIALDDVSPAGFRQHGLHRSGCTASRHPGNLCHAHHLPAYME